MKTLEINRVFRNRELVEAAEKSTPYYTVQISDFFFIALKMTRKGDVVTFKSEERTKDWLHDFMVVDMRTARILQLASGSHHTATVQDRKHIIPLGFRPIRNISGVTFYQKIEFPVYDFPEEKPAPIPVPRSKSEGWVPSSSREGWIADATVYTGDVK